MKLISVKRTLSIYKKDNYKLKSEITINATEESLKEIVSPKDDDEHLYLPYELSKSQIIQIITKWKVKIELDFDLYLYVLECIGNYEGLPQLD